MFFTGRFCKLSTLPIIILIFMLSISLASPASSSPGPDSVLFPAVADAEVSSANGEAACASCHVFGNMDDLAWDLGDPSGVRVSNPNPFVLERTTSAYPSWNCWTSTVVCLRFAASTFLTARRFWTSSRMSRSSTTLSPLAAVG